MKMNRLYLQVMTQMKNTHNTEWKKLDTKEYNTKMLYKVPKEVKLIYGDRRQNGGYLWEGGINDWEGHKMGVLG